MSIFASINQLWYMRIWSVLDLHSFHQGGYRHCPAHFYPTFLTSALKLSWLKEEIRLFKHFCSWPQRWTLLMEWPTRPGPRFNIKMTSYWYRKSHCGDKTILRPSYLHNGISYTGKTTSLYWIGAQMIWWKNDKIFPKYRSYLPDMPNVTLIPLCDITHENIMISSDSCKVTLLPWKVTSLSNSGKRADIFYMGH